MIRIEGNYTLAAPREQVWPQIFDPGSLMALIPGCRRLEQVSPGEFRGQVQVGLASVGGAYDTVVRVLAIRPPEICQLEGEISGPTGLIKGNATFTLQESGEQSLLHYESQALATGALARLSPRFVEGVISSFLKIGLANLNRQVQRAAPSLE